MRALLAGHATLPGISPEALSRPARTLADDPRHPVRVLLWHWGRAGAGAKFTMELAQEMKNLPGIDIELSVARGSELQALAPKLGVPTHSVLTFNGDKSSWRGQAAAAIGLTRFPLIADSFGHLLTKRRIDVALCTMQAIWDAATLPALSRSRARSVLILHDASYHPGDDYPFRKAVLRRQIRGAAALIVLSEHVRQEVIQTYGYPTERIWKMSLAAFAFGHSDVRPALHPRGTRRLRVLFFGRIVAYKGLDHLLRAHRALLQRGISIDIVIAGAGSLEPYADRLEGLPGVQVHNRWLSDQEIAAFMAEADIVVLPYVEASQSAVAAAAYAAGRPVVATPVGGLTEQVRHGSTGLLARDMSVEALADALQTFATQPDLLDRCGRNAMLHARTELSWKNSAEVVAEAIGAVSSANWRGAR